MDCKQYVCVCCMCSELKRILPSPHIPEIPQQRFVLYFSPKFGCKAVTREEERFNLVLGPRKPQRLFPRFPLSLGHTCRVGGRHRVRLWASRTASSSVCPGDVLQTQDRPIKCIIDYSCYFWHCLLIWQTKGALWKKRFLCVCLSCPDSWLSEVRSRHEYKGVLNFLPCVQWDSLSEAEAFFSSFPCLFDSNFLLKVLLMLFQFCSSVSIIHLQISRQFIM